MQAHRIHRPRALPRLAAAGVLTLAASAAGAQAAAEPAPDAASLSVRDVIARSYGLAEQDGLIQAAGPGYAATFEPGRFTYTPALGRTAPATMPVSFTLEQVLLGDTVLLDVQAPVAPVREGELVVYPHAGGIDERYEVRADGVHQTFRFESLPAGGGDLVVRGHLETDLAREACGTGARFLLPGFGGVTWGAVTGIDAGGATAAGEVRLDGSDLLLVLPADFLAGASLPLVLDPLVGSVFDGVVGVNDDYDPDVAFDATEKVYLVAWERWYSATHTDLQAQRFTAGGTPTGSAIYVASNPVIFETFGAFNPSVASVNKTGRFLVTWQQTSEASPTMQIRAAAIDADDGQISGSMAVSTTVQSQYNAVVGGERTELDDDALVVWQENNVGIRMRQIAVPPVGNPFTVTPAATLAGNTPGFFKATPAISRSGGDAGRFLVAWTRSSGTNVADIEARVVSRDGQALGSEVLVSPADLELIDRMPKLDGDGNRWVVAWERQEIFVPAKYDVVVRSLSWNGAGLDLESDDEYLEADIDDHEFAPSVAWTGASALVTYLDEQVAFTSIFAKAVDPFLCGGTEAEMVIAAGSGTAFSTTAASDWSAGEGLGTLDNAWILFDFVAQGGVDPDVLLAKYDAPDDPVDLGGGCDGGGINVNPGAFEGNPDFHAQLLGAAPNAPTFWVVSWVTEPFVSGLCTWTPKLLPGTIIIPRLTDNDGDAAAQAPIPLGTADLTIYTQWATLHAGGGSPLLGGVSFSNALEVTIQP